MPDQTPDTETTGKTEDPAKAACKLKAQALGQLIGPSKFVSALERRTGRVVSVDPAVQYELAMSGQGELSQVAHTQEGVRALTTRMTIGCQETRLVIMELYAAPEARGMRSKRLNDLALLESGLARDLVTMSKGAN